jgi:hypothetical protein
MHLWQNAGSFDQVKYENTIRKLDCSNVLFLLPTNSLQEDISLAVNIKETSTVTLHSYTFH